MDKPSNESLLLRQDDAGIATLTLNRPQARNALSMALMDELLAAFTAFAGDTNVRVVILAGSGPGFCSGHDLKELRSRPTRESYEAVFRRCSELMLSIVRLPKPVVARVRGIATAAGCQLVATCDLAVAADTARFALPGVNIGVFCTTPAVGVSRNIGRKRAMEMLLTGELFDAQTALSWGLVNRVVPAEALDECIRTFTDIIVARSPAAVRLGKAAFYGQVDRPLAAAYDLASETMACNLLLDDAAEGMDAFLQKRSARWSGR